MSLKNAPMLLHNISKNIQLPITLTVCMLHKSLGHVADAWKICVRVRMYQRSTPPSSLIQAYLFLATRLSIGLYVFEQPLR